MTINLIFCFIVVVVLATCITLFWWSYRNLKESHDVLQVNIKNLEKLNSELRAQRHDYLNHLQVVYGLMELEAYDDLKHYLQPVYKSMIKTGKALKTSKPAINALLKAKMDEAESREIDFYIEVKSDLKNLQIEDWELCKVLSNLLDNAMTALEEKEGEKKIELDITEDKDSYHFVVSNNGPEIPMHLRETIFKQGFSSKKGEGHGMGLYIVMNVIKEYRGTIELKSSEKETKFTVSFCEKKEGDSGWK